MYNLIVTAAADSWDNESFVLPVERYLEHTDEKIAALFRALDDSAKEQLTKLPTLFAYETPVNRDARVGWVRNIQRRDDSLRLQLGFDTEIERIAPERIDALQWDLEIGEYEMNRTHWAVKEADLLSVLAGRASVDADAPPYRAMHSASAAIPTAVPLDNSSATSALRRTLDDYLPDALRERFEIVCHLGSGSYGAVYQVADKESLQRFALKVLNNTPDARQRARRELDAVKLFHPNILPAVEHHADGHWFLFPLAEGTLGQLQSWDRLDSESPIDLARSVGAALSHAHGAGFLHRDLHPDNILRLDGRWTVTDWGLTIAREHLRLTRTRSVGGTETWTAPEQLRSLKDADHRSDLFSLGRIVEWLVSGALPDPKKAGQLPSDHGLAPFVAAATALAPNDRPDSVMAALALIRLDAERPTHKLALPQKPQQHIAKNLDVELSLTFRKIRITEAHHDYELLVSVKNVSRRRWDDWELEFEFATALMGGTIYGTKVADRSNADTSLFRVEGRKINRPLRPGDEQVARIGYFVNEAIYLRRDSIFDLDAKARVSLNGTIVAEVVRPVRELQDF